MSAELLTYQMGIPPNVYSGVFVPQCENKTNSRWHELFGTPERTARTLVERLDVGVIEWCNYDCDNCPYEYNQYGCEQVLTLSEWLRGEA